MKPIEPAALAANAGYFVGGDIFGARKLALNFMRIFVIINQQIMWVGASAPTLWRGQAWP